ncbi:MAG: hypothetical protein OEY59_13655 [Deltaproteobacteria bacterium]|nr:hypothetical protein [Deltaproteobacteria bacterium]
MNNYSRKRALDAPSLIPKKQVVYNPLFESSIPELDEIFERGLPLNLNYYVKRKAQNNEWFEDFLAINLFSTHQNPTGKVYIVEGNVGSGKSSLCKYWQKKHEELSGDNALVIILDVWPTEEDDEINHPELTEMFIESVFDSLSLKKFFETKADFFKSVLSSMGFNGLSQDILLKMSKELSSNDIVDFLVFTEVIAKVLIVIDNIDETSQATIKSCRNFALQVSKKSRRHGTKPFSIVMPMRQYTRTRYFDQEHFAHIELPSVSISEIVNSKLEQATDTFASITREYSQQISYVKTKYPKKEIYGLTVRVTPEKSCYFFQQMSKVVLSSKEQSFLDLITSLSNSNLKILIGNMYNFIHSCKLPLTQLFEKSFVPPEHLKKKDFPEAISFTLGLECLMNIHYPFYDVNASHIINLFNVVSSDASNDYKNSLCISRLLCFLLNNSDQKYESVISRMDFFGYTSFYTNAAIDKCFTYGLIKSDYGRKHSHLTKKSSIAATNIAKLYIYDLLYTRYLQYVSEDTFMEEEYIVPVIEKYFDDCVANSSDLLKNRKKSEEKFIKFLQKEEDFEKKYISNTINYNWDDFLSEFGITYDNKYLSISDFIKAKSTQ